MTASRHEMQFVALTMADGAVAVMQFIVRAWAGDALIYEREADNEAIQAEIDRTPLGQPVASWRRINPDELPQDRADRSAWRDDGKVIGVDPDSILASRKVKHEHQ